MNRTLYLFSILLLSLSPISAQQTTRVLLKSENKLRAFTIHTPSGYDGTERLPLVLNMHGFTMNGNQQMQYTGMNTTSNLNKFIVVYPDGVDGRWATGAFFGIDHPYNDVGFLNTIVDFMTYNYNIDPQRTYAAGYSAGAFMSLSLACTSSSRFAAAAPVAGNMNFSELDACAPSRRIPITFFNGLADDIVPVTGFPGQFPPLEEIVRFWSHNDLCDPVTREDTLPNTNTTDNSRVTLTVYPPCSGSSEVQFYKILNGGHTWPGAGTSPLGNTNLDISANDIIWTMFSQYQVPNELTVDRPTPFSITNIGGNNYRISFSEVPDAASYEISVWSPEEKLIMNYPLTTTSKDIVVTDTTSIVAVGAVASSGYKDWTLAQALKGDISTGNTNFLSLNGNSLPYPNPAGEEVFIDLNKFSGSISLLDITGRHLRTEKVENISGRSGVSLKGLEEGLYLIQLENAEGSTVFKVFKQ